MPNLTRSTAILSIAKLKYDEPLVIASTWLNSKALYSLGHRDRFLYNRWAYWETWIIALGIAENTNKEVVVIDWDGSFLAWFANYPIILERKPKNLHYYILRNWKTQTTWWQPLIQFPKLDKYFTIFDIDEDDRKPQNIEITIEENVKSFMEYLKS